MGESSEADSRRMLRARTKGASRRREIPGAKEPGPLRGEPTSAGGDGAVPPGRVLSKNDFGFGDRRHLDHQRRRQSGHGKPQCLPNF